MPLMASDLGEFDRPNPISRKEAAGRPPLRGVGEIPGCGSGGLGLAAADQTGGAEQQRGGEEAAGLGHGGDLPFGFHTGDRGEYRARGALIVKDQAREFDRVACRTAIESVHFYPRPGDKSAIDPAIAERDGI